MNESTADHRLRVLRSTELLDSAPERAFDRLTRLASGLLGAPVALVSLVDDRRQFFKSAFGLGEPWASRRETPLSHSFCQYAVRERAPFIVNDASQHPLVKDNLAIPDLGVQAYAGVPLMVGGEAIGAFCVIDSHVREWTEKEIALLQDLAESVVSEIDLRLSLRAEQEQRAITDALLESLADGVLAIDHQHRFLVVNEAARAMFAGGAEAGQIMPADWILRQRARLPDGSRMQPEEGVLLRALRGESTNGVTVAIQRSADAAPVWIDIRGRAVRNAKGDVIAGIGVYRDVTENQRKMDLYATLVANIPNAAAILFDKEQRCIARDGALVRARDGESTYGVGMTMREYAGAVGDPSFDAVEEVYGRTLTGESLTTETVYKGRHHAIHTAPVRDAFGAVVGGISLAIDVTEAKTLEAAHRREQEIYRAMVQHLPDAAVFMVDRDLRFVAADGPAADAITQSGNHQGYVGRYLAEVTVPENRGRMVSLYSAALRGEKRRVEVQREGRYYDVQTIPISDGSEITHALSFVHDVTDRRKEAAALRLARDLLDYERALLQTTLEHIDDGVALLDPERNVLLSNKAFAEMFGLGRGTVDGLNGDAFYAHLSGLVESPEILEELRIPNALPTSELTLVRPRRRILRREWVQVKLSIGDGYLVTWHDITAERMLHLERERLLMVDELTGIPNRRAAEGSLRVEEARMRRSGSPLCVAVFDIDHFKKVNDTFGHGTGDAVLRDVAATLASQVRITDTVARWGGEEFIAVLPGGIEGARAFCERARQAIENFRCPEVERVTISVGAVELREGEKAADAIARADALLYKAKNAGRNRVVAE